MISVLYVIRIVRFVSQRLIHLLYIIKRLQKVVLLQKESHQVRMRCPGEVPPLDEYRRRLVTPMNSLVRFGLMVNLNAEKGIDMILEGSFVD